MVTRRGADPVRQGDDMIRNFMSMQDFPDLNASADDPWHAEFVPDVAMPLHDFGDEAEGSATGGPIAEDAATSPPEPPLHVGLVTYAPRFDPEREEWYVDVNLGPARAGETFVRLGLVRYQPNTVPSLRCSRPVVQWTQPMPHRWTQVTPFSDPETGKTGISIEASGPSYFSRYAPVGMDEPTRKRLMSPTLRLTIFEEVVRPDGSLARFVLANAQQGDEPADRVRISPTEIKDGTCFWTARLERALFERSRSADSM